MEIDLDALKHTAFSLKSKLSSDRSRILLALLGLDRAVSASDGPAQFEGSVAGTWGSPLRLKAKMTGAGFLADAQGTAARWVVAGPKAADRLRGIPRFRHAASLPGNELFENLTVMPRFFVVHQALAVSSLAEARALIDRREIDFRQAAIADAPIALPAAASGSDAVKVLEYRPNAVELDVRSRGSGLLVASETHYPGWQAWVDGRPAPIHLVDIALRGVVVPDGAHRIRMEFRPRILWVSLAITLATAALLAMLGWRRAE